VPDAGSYVWQQGASVITEALATGKERSSRQNMRCMCLRLSKQPENQCYGERIRFNPLLNGRGVIV